MAVVRASDIRRLPAHIVFERHHDPPCARAWEGEKWWDGISDPPLKGKMGVKDIWRPYSAIMCGYHCRRLSLHFFSTCRYPRFRLPKVCYVTRTWTHHVVNLCLSASLTFICSVTSPIYRTRSYAEWSGPNFEHGNAWLSGISRDGMCCLTTVPPLCNVVSENLFHCPSPTISDPTRWFSVVSTMRNVYSVHKFDK